MALVSSSYIYGFMIDNKVVDYSQIAFIGYRVFETDIQISFLLSPMTPRGHIVMNGCLSMFIVAATKLAFFLKLDYLTLHYTKVMDNLSNG